MPSGPIKVDGLGEFWKMNEKFRTISTRAKRLRSTFVKHVGIHGEEGGQLTQKLAKKFLVYVKDGLRNQEYPKVNKSHSDFYRDIKKKNLPSTSDLFGIASGRMLNALEVLSVGKKGGYAVGIRSKGSYSGGEKYPADDPTRMASSGYQRDIATIAYMFEMGSTKNNQPPRPFLLPAFIDFVDDEVPDELTKSIGQELERFQDAMAAVGERPRLELWDAIDWSEMGESEKEPEGPFTEGGYYSEAATPRAAEQEGATTDVDDTSVLYESTGQATAAKYSISVSFDSLTKQYAAFCEKTFATFTGTSINELVNRILKYRGET